MAQPRKILKHVPTALNAADGEPIGRVLNLDAQGLMLECDNEPEIGQRLELRVGMDDDRGEAWTLCCTVEVLWCEYALAQERFWVGCAISDLSESTRERLARTVAAG